jgi:Ca2+-binding RTX toxin-like protein
MGSSDTVDTLVGQTGGDVVSRDDGAKTLVISVAYDLDESELVAVAALAGMGWDVEVVWAE